MKTRQMSVFLAAALVAAAAFAQERAESDDPSEASDLNFKDTDPAYAKSLKYAKALYDFAVKTHVEDWEPGKVPPEALAELLNRLDALDDMARAR